MSNVRDTSIKVYYDLIDEGYVSDRQQLIINFLLVHPCSTDSEIAFGLGFDDPNNVRPRRKELFDMGLVLDVGKRVCRVTGRTVYQWKFNTDLTRDKVVLCKESLFRTFTSKSFLEIVCQIVIFGRENVIKKVNVLSEKYVSDFFSNGVFSVEVEYQ